jgi:hypothetical protein
MTRDLPPFNNNSGSEARITLPRNPAEIPASMGKGEGVELLLSRLPMERVSKRISVASEQRQDGEVALFNIPIGR